MNAQEGESTDLHAIPHVDEVFEGKSIYLSGQSFVRCAFRSCTLIIKDITALGILENCTFENCVWHLSITISDPQAWQEFVQKTIPTITTVLPRVETRE